MISEFLGGFFFTLAFAFVVWLVVSIIVTTVKAVIR